MVIICFFTSDKKTHDVKTKQPNELGIYDMSGNVSEWTSSYWRKDYGSSVDTRYRVERGGSWHSSVRNVRVPCRSGISPFLAIEYLGSRLAM